MVGNKAYAQYAMRQKVLKHQIELRQAAEAQTMADLAAEVKQAAAQAEKDRLAAEAAKWVTNDRVQEIFARQETRGAPWNAPSRRRISRRHRLLDCMCPVMVQSRL